MASFTTIQNQIDSAPASANGLVPWTGSNGEYSILSNLNSSLRDKGILVVADLSALTAVTGNDAHVIYVVGLGIYRWVATPPTIPPPTGDIIASGGGYWNLMAPYGNVYQEIIDTTDNLTFTINHGINWAYNFPSVRAIDAASPHALIPISAVTYPSAISLTVAFDNAYANKQIVILVQV